MMKILVFAHDATMYGASQSLLTALRGISERPDRKLLVILPYKGMLEQALVEYGIEYSVRSFPRCVEFKNKSTSLWRTLKKYRAYRRQVRLTFPDLEKIGLEFRPDVIYTNTSVVAVGYALARKLRVPHVWHIREFGDRDYDFIYFPSSAAR